MDNIRELLLALNTSEYDLDDRPHVREIVISRIVNEDRFICGLCCRLDCGGCNSPDPWRDIREQTAEGEWF